MRDRLVLVTGGLGYLGTALVPALAKRWPVRVYDSMMFGNAIADAPNVEFVQGDIRDREGVKASLDGVTDVVHLAGVVTDELVGMNPRKAESVNVEAMAAFLEECARMLELERFVFASSSSVYGTQSEGVVATEETEPKPMTLYAEQKLWCEQALYCYMGSFTVVSVRCATLCGPAPRMRLDTIVNTFCKQAWFDSIIRVHGGDQWRTNVHVQDAVDFYTLMLEAPDKKVNGQVFNCTGENRQALDLAELVAMNIRAYRFRDGRGPSKVDVDETRRDDRSYRMSAAKADRILDWKPKRTLRDAIIDNFDFFARSGVQNPDDDLYYNTRRMRGFMKEDA